MTADEFAAADSDSAVIVCDQGVLEDGSPYWVYIAVKPSLYQTFLRAVAERSLVRFEEYGQILTYGLDGDIPLPIKEEMERLYKFDDNYLSALAQKVKQAQIAFLKDQESQRLGDIVAMMKKKQQNGG